MTERENNNERMGFNRRNFLRGAITTGISLSGVSAVTGLGSAHTPQSINGGTLPLSGLTWEGDPGTPVTYDLQISGGVTQNMEDGARDAIAHWRHVIKDHTKDYISDFKPASGGSPDIEIKVKRGGGRIAGQELTHDRDNDGAADKSRVQISGSSYGDYKNAYVLTKSVTLHELGHSFQLGHYDGPDTGDEVMSPTVQDPPVQTLSECDIHAFNKAHENRPDPPTKGSVDC